MASATNASPSMLASNVPLWITDDRWWEWHAWLPDTPMGDDGESRTACGLVWHWSATLQTTYNVLADVSCEACYQAQIGNRQPRGRGRPKRLPQGPLAKSTPRRDDLPSRLRDPDVLKPTPIGRPSLGFAERDEQKRLAFQAKKLAAGATQRSYTRQDGQVVTLVQSNKAVKAVIAAEESELDFSFEVGTRLGERHCPQCAQVTVTGDLYCSRWCWNESVKDDLADRYERSGRIMARRQFLDMLYGRPRRDSIKSWTPPYKQIRKRHDYDSV